MTLRLASINLHCGLDHRGRPFSVKEAVASLDADVLLVQENWCRQGAESLARTAAADCGYPTYVELAMTGDVPMAELEIVSGPAPEETGAWGLAVLSRLPVHRYATVDLGAAPGDVVGDRAAQLVEIPLDAGVLRVVNVHLTHRVLHGPRQLRRLVAGLGTDGPPTVIGGDLNMFRPTVLLARPYRPVVRGRTYPAHRPLLQLDHVLAGPGVAATNPAVLAAVGTDHRPVTVDVGLG
ncbi:endonuclease/exonuclease/phosphatase family metal-dependent hydrolase [Krasilnikovia cinnamomea]|uniref:Endonuclease/exonuclease/phosphatase family metal-dependent hydrolase n=1 Tax=Krasilnikovia cinnamomea TaxID=349313 RepID=A0A4Q7ZTE9_9ACTN|nr:endonuclease/exonuclease/phosphatase family protein [Krasilnikovia cinnamomea]RZU54194.1 endonuclease/exonuclease/phosphatase family metal-dependent hydrolase [Krasilnikovia cinnamomea]